MLDASTACEGFLNIKECCDFTTRILINDGRKNLFLVKRADIELLTIIL